MRGGMCMLEGKTSEWEGVKDDIKEGETKKCLKSCRKMKYLWPCTWNRKKKISNTTGKGRTAG